MTASSPSSLISTYKNNSIFWNNQRNMLSSPYSKILHDPECQSHCCSGNVNQPLEANNCNDLDQCSSFERNYSYESILTAATCENQSFYEANPSKEVPEFQAILSQSVVDKLEMANPGLIYEKPINRTGYTSCYMNVNSAEGRCKQRSNCKGVTKRKRKRTIFSTEQIIVMEGVFKKRPYVSKEEKVFLSQRLNISEKAIKIWFQNRRRVTEKRDMDQSDSYHSDSTVEDGCNDYNTRLDYIESQINQNADEHGFVTLDSKSLSELVNLIDSVLSKNIDCHTYEDKNIESYLMYEPVSPESLSDDHHESDNILTWEPSKPEESLQRLIDIHSVFYS